MAKDLLPLPSETEDILAKYLKERDIRYRSDREIDAGVRAQAKRLREPRKYTPRARKPRPKPLLRPKLEEEVECETCGEKFWRATTAKTRFCSKTCAGVARRKVHSCNLCCAEFTRFDKDLVTKDGKTYCSEVCYEKFLESSIYSAKEFDKYYRELCRLRRRQSQEGPPPTPLQRRDLQSPTYCHHCIENEADCEARLGDRWMPICTHCEGFFAGKHDARVSYPMLDVREPWPIRGAVRRKPMLHEIERRGGKQTLNTGFMILTLDWVRS